ncbi:CNVH-domain-containing protein [Hypoxylon sp. FL1150]|nr:CNVH-domain-containing protein [Hypoxylon sp. FL1150]
MAFSLTAKNVELRGSWLVAAVQQPDGSWSLARLDLNDHIGNNDGAFDVAMDRWYNTAEGWSCHLRGPVLCARLRTVAGEYAPERCINLDLFVKNHDGSLEFQDLTDSLLLYAGCLTLQDATRLRGVVVNRDGKFVPSEIDLDQHYGNINGKFEAGERHYSRSGRNVRLEQDATSVKLFAELADCEGEWHEAEVDISECIVNDKGKLAFLKHDEEFVREDWTPAIVEHTPVMGEAVAGLHTGEDKEDHFYYQIASNTNSVDATVGIAIGSFIGRAIRSAAIGMAIGARLAASSDAFVDAKITSTIEDPEVRSQIQEAALGRHILETLRDLFAEDAAAASAELLEAALDPEIDTWTKGLVDWFEKQELPATVLSDISLHTMLSKVLKHLQGETVEEWTAALAHLATLQKSTTTLKLTPPPPPPSPPAPEPEPEPEVIVEEIPTAESEAKDVPVPAIQIEGPETQETQQGSPDSQAVPDSDAAARAAQAAQAQQDPKIPGALPTTAGSSSGTASTRQSSDAGASVSKTGSGSKDKGDKASVRGNGGNGAACTKGWHGIFGITTFRRSWARSKQPKVVTTS